MRPGIIAASLFFIGCPRQPPCTCDDGFVCKDGVCVQTCLSDIDCPAGTLCSVGECMPEQEVERPPSVTAPKLLRSEPPSPAPSARPRIIGTAPSGTRVALFDNPSCAGTPVTEGSATAFSERGISVEVAEDGAIMLYGLAASTDGTLSLCSLGLLYERDTVAPSAPVLDALAHQSSSAATAPTLNLAGTTDTDTTVALFANETCEGDGVPTIVEGTSFVGSLKLAANTITSIAALARDRAGNESACSVPLRFTHDNEPPVFGSASPLTLSEVGHTGVRLAWSAATDNLGAVHYQACQTTEGTCANDAFADVGAALEVTFASLSILETYAFAIRPVDTLGNVGVRSNTVTRQPAPLSGHARTACGGEGFTCVAFADGLVRCVGTGLQPGFGTSLSLILGFDGVVQLACGDAHVCALSANGMVWCFGDNGEGQVGSGSLAETVTEPEQVATLDRVRSIAAGGDTTCAVRGDGSAWCWGEGSEGQLMRDSTEDARTPVSVAIPNPVGVIAIGQEHACATTGQGVVCWGNNTFGQRDGTPANAEPTTFSPVNDVGHVLELALGARHSCALNARREVFCWGNNDTLQLGMTRLTTVPVRTLAASDTRPLHLTAGAEHTCLIGESTDSSVIGCFGDNQSGQLGVTAGVVPSLLEISSFSNPLAVTAGTKHTCVVRADGGVTCWGQNISSQLGGAAVASRTAMDLVASAGAPLYSSVRASGNVTCASASDGSLWCFGDNYLPSGQEASRPLWIDSTADRVGTPSRVRWAQVAAGLTTSSVSVSADHVCAVLDRRAYCWGSAQSFVLGGDTDRRTELPTVPVYQRPTSMFWVDVQTVAGHTCGIDTQGELSCWGQNGGGQLGSGSSGASSPPASVLLGAGQPLTGVHQVALGDAHSCALVDGQVHCWGVNSSGQLGVAGGGTSYARALSLLDVASLSVGSDYTCVVGTNGSASCWGAQRESTCPGGCSNCTGINNGVLGIGRDEGVSTATAVSLPEGVWVKKLATGDDHACALTSDGRVFCWGASHSGQLGDGSPFFSMDAFMPECGGRWPNDNCAMEVSRPGHHQLQPRQVSGLTSVIDIAVGESHSCAVDASGKLHCWGNNSSGQLGTGYTGSSGWGCTGDNPAWMHNVPVQALGPAQE